MSRHLCELDVGNTIDFKHIPFNVKIQAPFQQKHIAMIVGGTGITPMIQALHAILGSEKSSDYKVSMLYGSKVSDDILAEQLLNEWANEYSDQFFVKHVLSDEPKKSNWDGERGYITAELIKSNFPPPSLNDDIIIFVCGPPPMMKAICGPREDKEVTGILAELGYSSSQVFKF